MEALGLSAAPLPHLIGLLASANKTMQGQACRNCDGAIVMEVLNSSIKRAGCAIHAAQQVSLCRRMSIK